MLCVTFASQLNALWCMVSSVFCFHVAAHVRLHAMGNKLENALPPLPILRPHPTAPRPPFDNSMAHSFSAPMVQLAPWPIYHAPLYLTAFVCPLQPPSCSFCYVSHSPCTYVPSVLICSLLCMSLLTQREMSVLYRRQVCTEPLPHIGHSFVFNLPLEARKYVLGLDCCVSDADI